MKGCQNNVKRSGSHKQLRLQDLRIRLVPIGELVPDPKNARTHSESQISGLASSIREFGWTNPVLVKPDFRIIAGHARLGAARELGLNQVPIIVLDGLTESQYRALALADNQLPLNAGWDENLLRTELAALEQRQFDLKMIGFEQRALKRLLKQQPTRLSITDPNANPSPPRIATSQTGDLWLLGEHRLLCGDGAQTQMIHTLMDGDHADLVFTTLPFETWQGAQMVEPLELQSDPGDNQPIAWRTQPVPA